MMSSSNNVSSIARLQTDMASKKAELAEIAAELSKLNSRKRRVEKEMKSLKEELEFLNGNQSNHSNLDRDDFPWSSDAVAKLKLIFKIDSFRSHQKAAINATMSKIDCILIMPTGTDQYSDTTGIPACICTVFKSCAYTYTYRRWEVALLPASCNTINGHNSCDLPPSGLDGRSAPRSPGLEDSSSPTQ